ncbi:MAG TPA: M28 family peptidase [Candidatus Polarisedimenticolia bacterium]|nr:M28 family peptidase [Candidatus Polarisedimenticolia bacterium]
MQRTHLLALCLAAAGTLVAPGGSVLGREPERDSLPLGFSSPAWDEERSIEKQFVSHLDRSRISRTHQELTKEPHRAGTEGSRRIALFIRQEAEKAGFKPEVTPYLFYGSHPGTRSIALTAPIRKPLSLAEDVVPGDPFAQRTGDHLAFCAYSGSGTAEGEVVYAGQGTVAEFRALEERGIDLKGRIVLMRYFGEGEGRKVLRAQEKGAVGAILYADPQEDGFIHGPVYPQGGWRPPGSIMRRTLVDTPYEGDPLSPGWASVPGAKRLDPKKVEGLPRIPVLPISYRDAALILTHLEGPEAPGRMQGGLRKRPGGAAAAGAPRDVTLVESYRLGPGPARVRLSVEMQRRTDTIRNVLVRIPGKEEPDSWVILGNHHDAWIYGAGDPSSGTAALLEILRSFGRMQGLGWQPRRTIVVAFWDAEEMNLGGSTEWAEANAEVLRRKGAAVINMDSAVFNGERPLYVGASPCLHRLFRETAADVPGPTGKGSLFDEWVRLQNKLRGVPSVDAFEIGGTAEKPLVEPQIDDVPLGDDQTPFVEFLALPGSDMYYGADYGMYHSLYENRHWMTTVVDPQFRLHRMMAEFQGRLGLRLAMAPVLPLDPDGTAAAWGRAFEDLEERAGERHASPKLLRPVERALRRFRDAAESFARERDEILTVQDWPLRPLPERLAAVNREVSEAEKAFFSENGLPGHPWYRGLWVAPPRPVPGLTEARLPGLRWPLELDQEGTLLRQVDLYTQALDEATAHLHRAEGLLSITATPDARTGL